jgi:integrase/recombinase XerD
VPKERCTPLSRATCKALQQWLRERGGQPASPLFPNHSGQHLTRGAIWRLVVKHAATASEYCPSLVTKNITPHTLRHTAALRMLHAPTPIDTATIALWLGTRTSTPPTSTSTPTWNSNDVRLTARHHRTPSPDATDHQTPARVP